MITIDTHIPSGNIIYDYIDNEGVIHAKLNMEFALFTHWFLFKIINDEVNRPILSVSIDNAGQSLYAIGWKDYAPFESIDGKNWQRISQGYFDGNSFKFNINIQNKELYLSWYLPYTIERYNEWIKQISKSKALTVQSNNGVDYIVAGDKQKPAIVIVARQHSGESMTSYIVEGFVNAILSKKELLDNFFKNYSLIIFPLLNKSGVEKGYHRVNGNGIDLNRSWNSNKIEEIKTVKEQLSTFVKIYTIIDIHGDEVSKFNYIYCDVNSKNKSQKDFLNIFCNTSPKITALPKQKFIKRFIKQLIRKGKFLTNTGETLSDFGKKKYKTNTYTLEVSAKNSSENDCLNIGRNILSAILQNKLMQ
jgi:hypothetical protein